VEVSDHCQFCVGVLLLVKYALAGGSAGVAFRIMLLWHTIDLLMRNVSRILDGIISVGSSQKGEVINRAEVQGQRISVFSYLGFLYW